MVKPDILDAVIIAVAILAVLAAALLPLNYAFVTATGLIILNWALLICRKYRIRKNDITK